MSKHVLIDRRTYLKGIGAALALPLLDVMGSEKTVDGTTDKPPVRLGFMYMPHGVIMDQFLPADAASFILLQEQLEGILHTLSEREKRVIQLRFGMTDGRPRTLEEVGSAFGVTRERIRQIESKTLSKLRHPSRSQQLRDYLEE